MTIDRLPLPYAADALEPYISKQTLEIHHGKHHKAYVDKLNALIADTDDADKPLRTLVETSAQDPKKQMIFNNAAQAWNHAFYWQSMCPQGGGAPRGELAARIKIDFGSAAALVSRFCEAAAGHFGSGWAWLVIDNGKLSVMQTSNADTPIVHGQIPLLTIDVWEHAYYLDYQNRRPDYVDTFFAHLVNWDFAAQNIPRDRMLERQNTQAHQSSASL